MLFGYQLHVSRNACFNHHQWVHLSRLLCVMALPTWYPVKWTMEVRVRINRIPYKRGHHIWLELRTIVSLLWYWRLYRLKLQKWERGSGQISSQHFLSELFGLVTSCTIVGNPIVHCCAVHVVLLHTRANYPWIMSTITSLANPTADRATRIWPDPPSPREVWPAKLVSDWKA